MKEILSNSDAKKNNEKTEIINEAESWKKIRETEAIKFLDISPETEENIKNNPHLEKLLGEILDYDEGSFEHSLRTADLGQAIITKNDLNFNEEDKEIFFTAATISAKFM